MKKVINKFVSESKLWEGCYSSAHGESCVCCGKKADASITMPLFRELSTDEKWNVLAGQKTTITKYQKKKISINVCSACRKKLERQDMIYGVMVFLIGFTPLIVALYFRLSGFFAVAFVGIMGGIILVAVLSPLLWLIRRFILPGTSTFAHLYPFSQMCYFDWLFGDDPNPVGFIWYA